MNVLDAEIVPSHPLARGQPEQPVEQANACHGTQAARRSPVVFRLVNLDQSIPHPSSHLRTGRYESDTRGVVARGSNEIG
jgi:hypothetical protein